MDRVSEITSYILNFAVVFLSIFKRIRKADRHCRSVLTIMSRDMLNFLSLSDHSYFIEGVFFISASALFGNCVAITE